MANVIYVLIYALTPLQFSLDFQQYLLEHFISSLRNWFHWIELSLLARLLAPFSFIYLHFGPLQIRSVPLWPFSMDSHFSGQVGY